MSIVERNGPGWVDVEVQRGGSGVIHAAAYGGSGWIVTDTRGGRTYWLKGRTVNASVPVWTERRESASWWQTSAQARAYLAELGLDRASIDVLRTKFPRTNEQLAR